MAGNGQSSRRRPGTPFPVISLRDRPRGPSPSVCNMDPETSDAELETRLMPKGIHPESGGRPRCRQAGPEPVGLRLGPHATMHGDRPPGPLSTRPGPAPLGGQETAGHTRRLNAGPGHRPSHSVPLARCCRQHPKSPTSPELGGVDYIQLTSLPVMSDIQLSLGNSTGCKYWIFLL